MNNDTEVQEKPKHKPHPALFALLSGVVVFSLMGPTAAFAHCPLCTAATGALVATSRVAGVDDAVTGTFVGAFTISIAFWLNRYFVNRFKRRHLPLQPYLFSVIFVAFTLAGFYWAGLLTGAGSSVKIVGLDRLVFGTLLGSLVTVAGFEFHSFIRKVNGNKNYFPLQGVVLPVVLVLAANAVMYALGVAW